MAYNYNSEEASLFKDYMRVRKLRGKANEKVTSISAFHFMEHYNNYSDNSGIYNVTGIDSVEESKVLFPGKLCRGSS